MSNCYETMKELILLLYIPKYIKRKSKQIKGVTVMHYLDAVKFKPKKREMPKLISSIILLVQIIGPLLYARKPLNRSYSQGHGTGEKNTFP